MNSKRFQKWVLFYLTLLIILSFSGRLRASSLWSDRFEKTLGKGAVPEVVRQYGGEYIPPIPERMWLEEIFRRLTAVTERSEIEYSLMVLNSFEYNAFALPGGYTFITRGLLQLLDMDEAKLAAVLGHEIAHVERRHGITAVLRQMGLAVAMEVGVMWLDVLPPELLRVASATLMELLKLGWGREAEYEADAVGQSLAVRAGFDAIGAVAVLDDLLEMDPDELPAHIFSSHPDTRSRRRRVAENLISFWPAAKKVLGKREGQILETSRNSDQNGRTDPKGRFEVSLPGSATGEGLAVWDNQRRETLIWLMDYVVHEFVWSPTGDYGAAIVQVGEQRELWLYDRYGYAVQKREFRGSHSGPIVLSDLCWSPGGEMLALEFSNLSTDPQGDSLGGAVVVTYLNSEVYLPITDEAGGSDPIWLEDGLYFRSCGAWYRRQAPRVEPMRIQNPVPRVLQRRRVLSPTVIREEGSIRLTRPSLNLP